jgi:hypothetical protein
MTVEFIRSVLAWCTVINLALLLWWFLWFTLAHDLMYRMHKRWFKLSVETFDGLNYVGAAFFKICIFVFNLVPYLVLRFIG